MNLTGNFSPFTGTKPPLTNKQKSPETFQSRVGKGTGDYCRAGKGSPCVAGGARARRCELCDGVADRGPQRDRVGGWARDHGAQAAAGPACGGDRSTAGKPGCPAERDCAASRRQPVKRAAHRREWAPAAWRSSQRRGAPNGGYAGNVAERRFAALEIGTDVKAADRAEPSTIQSRAEHIRRYLKSMERENRPPRVPLK